MWTPGLSNVIIFFSNYDIDNMLAETNGLDMSSALAALYNVKPVVVTYDKNVKYEVDGWIQMSRDWKQLLWTWVSL
jgi:hypothetical protein